MQQPTFVGRYHPLRELFSELVRRHFYSVAQIRNQQVASYVSELLVDFTHANNLYKIRDARGRRLDDVGEMLLESNPLLEASSFDRERQVRKHVGDYCLFMTGMFPESISSARRLKQMRVDAFVDYARAGKESYAVVASFDQFEYRSEAPLYRQLSDRFELCVFGLNLVRQDIERLRQQHYRSIMAAIER